jgi:tRNA(Ile)-lysidine synthase
VPRHIVQSIRESVRTSLLDKPRVVLAVSGGLDSMVLLDAAASSLPNDLLVATFDHGTGDAATEAAALVRRTAAALGLRVTAGLANRSLGSEAEWRDARWAFLRSVAAEGNAAIATAHTADDQVETVLMRVMRGAGARGLAGLYAAGDVIRPLLGHSRREIALYARHRRVAWFEDPTNQSRRFFRNRIRHDLLPAFRLANPLIDAELLEVARRAADLRREIETIVDSAIEFDVRADDRGLDVSLLDLAAHPAASLTVLWPVLAAKVGLSLDRRGIERLAAFSRIGRVGSRIQLSGGWEVVRAPNTLQVRRLDEAVPAPTTIDPANPVAWGTWSFRRAIRATSDPWTACLPAGQPLEVRVWRSGDAMTIRRGFPARKVKHFLSDAGISGHERARWPVVVAGDRVVWIPGIRRGEAATERSGRPGLVFSCVYDHR